MRTRLAGARHVVPSGPRSLPPLAHCSTEHCLARLCSFHLDLAQLMAVASPDVISCPSNVMMARILAIVDWKDLTPFPPLEIVLI